MHRSLGSRRRSLCRGSHGIGAGSRRNFSNRGRHGGGRGRYCNSRRCGRRLVDGHRRGHRGSGNANSAACYGRRASLPGRDQVRGNRNGGSANGVDGSRREGTRCPGHVFGDSQRSGGRRSYDASVDDASTGHAIGGDCHIEPTVHGIGLSADGRICEGDVGRGRSGNSRISRPAQGPCVVGIDRQLGKAAEARRARDRVGNDRLTGIDGDVLDICDRGRNACRGSSSRGFGCRSNITQHQRVARGAGRANEGIASIEGRQTSSVRAVESAVDRIVVAGDGTTIGRGERAGSGCINTGGERIGQARVGAGRSSGAKNTGDRTGISASNASRRQIRVDRRRIVLEGFRRPQNALNDRSKVSDVHRRENAGPSGQSTRIRRAAQNVRVQRRNERRRVDRGRGAIFVRKFLRVDKALDDRIERRAPTQLIDPDIETARVTDAAEEACVKLLDGKNIQIGFGRSADRRGHLRRRQQSSIDLRRPGVDIRGRTAAEKLNGIVLGYCGNTGG